MEKNFNIIITGVGGQGLITLVSIINQAAFIEGKDVRSSELHGLSQREGSVETHIKFGKKVWSPLAHRGQADLIIGLEILEALRAVNRAGSQTKFLVNNYFLPFEDSPAKEKALEDLNRNLAKNLYLVNASEICQKELQKEVLSGVYLLGYGINKKLIPLKLESVLSAIKEVIPEKYRDMNIKAFELSNHG